MSEAREPINESLRLLVTERAKRRCEYCRSPEEYATERFSIEHVRPRAVGGVTSLENLALACQGCNGHKSAKVESLDPESGETVRLFDPRVDEWEQHLAWSADRLEIVGLTPIGRATVALLRMNRPQLLNLRRALISILAH